MHLPRTMGNVDIQCQDNETRICSQQNQVPEPLIPNTLRTNWLYTPINEQHWCLVQSQLNFIQSGELCMLSSCIARSWIFICNECPYRSINRAVNVVKNEYHPYIFCSLKQNVNITFLSSWYINITFLSSVWPPNCLNTTIHVLYTVTVSHQLVKGPIST